MSERRACRVLALSRSVYRYQAKKTDEPQIEQALRLLAEQHRRWGYGKMIHYLKHQGYAWNHKRIHRIYCELALNLRRKPKKRLPARTALVLAQPTQANESWSLDFMSDSLASGRAFRTLNILDDYNREALWIEVDTSLPAERVIRVLELLLQWRGVPRQIRMDNGPEPSHSAWKAGPRTMALNWLISSPEGLRRMRILSVSTARFGKTS